MKPSPEFENGQVVYFMGRKADWVEIVRPGTHKESPLPHYWVRRDDLTTLESVLRLSPRPLDDKLDRHKNRSRSKKKAGDDTTPVSAANPTEVTQ